MTKTKMCPLSDVCKIINLFADSLPFLKDQHLHFHYDTNMISLIDIDGRKPMEGDDMSIEFSEEGDLYEITVTGDKSFHSSVGEVLEHIEYWFS